LNIGIGASQVALAIPQQHEAEEHEKAHEGEEAFANG
jgi:hypothetical protein